MTEGPRTWIATLRRSHDNLASLVEPMTPEQVRGQSYCRDWTNAQVLSHLGSGAEIALLMLPGALGEGPPASRDAFPPVWDVWNAKSPDDQAADAIASDEQHVQRLEQLTTRSWPRPGWTSSACSLTPPASAACASASTCCTPGTLP